MFVFDEFSLLLSSKTLVVKQIMFYDQVTNSLAVWMRWLIFELDVCICWGFTVTIQKDAGNQADNVLKPSH